ncbi:MAG: RHS repeat-associated core domain-containing protein [Methyloglobulus sp.]
MKLIIFINRLHYIIWGENNTFTVSNAIRVNNAAGTPAYAIGVGYNARNQVSSYGWQFTYDDLGHLSGQFVNSTTDKRRWTLRHDLNGNLEQQDTYSTTGALVRHDVLTYPATNNRVTSEAISPAPPTDGTGGSNVANVYDKSGFIIQQGPVSYQYDAARQMKRYLRSGVNVRYAYDGARRRVLKTGTGGTTSFVYDQADHLIYEVNPNGSRHNYVWLGDIPLAVIDQDAAGAKTAAYFIETDFSNTPRYLRRAVGDLTKVVWYWSPAPYGDFPATSDADGDGVAVSFNLRYPGQYYDAESKLHYNHTRTFQPRTGRYLQPDLIGLEGGINVYTYAGGNPVMYMDPTGTFWESSDGSASDGGLMGMIGSFFDSALSLFDSFAGNTISEGMTTGGAFYDLPQSSVPFLTLGEFGAAKGAAGAVTSVGREINLIDGFYQAEGSAFKFSEYYYDKLWSTGRGAPFLQAEEILNTANKVSSDRMAGFYRYTNEFSEMVYNPASKEVWHLQPLGKKPYVQ